MAQKNVNHKVGRLIVVDDEAELMTALNEMLARQGYETAGFTTAAEALEILKEQDYDLLLTDLMMPEMDGIEFLRKALEIDPDIVGIIMTGQGTVQTAVEAMKRGAFDYILKPFKLNTLMPVLSRAMDVRHLRLENMQLRETVAMHELGKAIAFSSDLNSILNKVADAALQQCDADEVSIMLPSRDGKELQIAAVRGRASEYLGEYIPIDSGIAGWVAQNCEPVTLHGEVDDRRFTPIKPRANIRAAVSMPMLAGGNLVGVLNVNITRSRRPFTLGQVKALGILVNIVSPILENTSLYIKVRQAEEKYRSIFENAVEGIFQSTHDGVYITVNPAFAHMFGYASPQEMMDEVSNIPKQLYADPEDRTRMQQLIETEGVVKGFEVERRRKDGSHFWVSLYARAVRDGKGNIQYYEGTIEDITQRKRVEEALRESEERYRIIMESVKLGVSLIDINHKIIMTNLFFAELFKKPAADFVGKHCFMDFEKREAICPHCPGVLAMASGKPAEVETEGVRNDGSRFNVLVRTAPTFASDGTVSGFVEVIEDITERKQTEEKLKNTLESLRKAVGTTIQVMVSAVEVRDPYTAGHQSRAANLACTIATEMGLPQEKIDGIRMAGSIHDIGKLSIPAEILSKPTKLTEIEFSLIKEHAQKGYEMLKDVESPWPLAEIVYQHHERMDGSGYPRNLKGEEIIMEGRIMAVSDVVEAMASHRPYRPAKGIDAALEEILKHKDILYDPAVVDVCLRLFREKGFQLGGT